MNARNLFSRIADPFSRIFLCLVAAWHALLKRAPDKLRAWPLLLLGLIAFAIVFKLNPAKLGLMLWGGARLAMCGYIGYWIDRILFPYARPHTLTGIAEGTAWKRRALIVAAAILAGALLP